MKVPKLYRFKEGKLIIHKVAKYIDYVEGSSNYSVFYFKDGSKRAESHNIGLHWSRLQEMERFVMIHRSIIVNLCAIQEITTHGTVLMKSGKELLCAKKRLPQLLQRFNIL